MKQCSNCLALKEKSKFYPGYRCCKSCYNLQRQEYKKQYRKKNKDYLKSYLNNYRVKHREEARAYSKLYGPSYYMKNKILIDNKHKNQYQKYKHTLNYRYKSYKNGAKNRKLEFNLTKDQLAEIINKPCSYCGQSKSLGIDRFDSAKGYIKDNCLPCCKKCNQMKWNYRIEEFLTHVLKIIKHLEHKT